MDFIPERISSCAGGAQWGELDPTTQILVVNTRNVSYDEAIDCCEENFGQMVKIDSNNKAYLLSEYLNGVLKSWLHNVNIVFKIWLTNFGGCTNFKHIRLNRNHFCLFLNK